MDAHHAVVVRRAVSPEDGRLQRGGLADFHLVDDGAGCPIARRLVEWLCKGLGRPQRPGAAEEVRKKNTPAGICSGGRVFQKVKVYPSRSSSIC